MLTLDEKLVSSGDAALGSSSNSPLSRSELRTEITKFLRDTTLIPDRTLAYEVYLVMQFVKKHIFKNISIAKVFFLKSILFYFGSAQCMMIIMVRCLMPLKGNL